MCVCKRISPHPCDLRFLRRFPTLNSASTQCAHPPRLVTPHREAYRRTRGCPCTALFLTRPNAVSARRRSNVTSREPKFRRERVVAFVARRSLAVTVTLLPRKLTPIRTIRCTYKLLPHFSTNCRFANVAFQSVGWRRVAR